MMTSHPAPHRREGDQHWLRDTLGGVVLLAIGAGALFYEMQHPPSHTPHVYVFAGLAVLGALGISPRPLLRPVRTLVVILAPILPWVKTPPTSPTDSLAGE